MAKVNYVIYDNTYTATTNSNMKFRLVIRSFDGTDRKSGTKQDSQYINGAIDGVDVASDHLGTSDLYQSEHIILREPENRVYSGYNYHMVESLANSCDNVSSSDYYETLSDKEGTVRECKQLYSKEADSRIVNVKSYIGDLLLDNTFFELQYKETNYGDTGPKATYIDAMPSDFQELQDELKNLAYNGIIFEYVSLMINVEDTYVTHEQTFYYKGFWSSSIKKVNGQFVQYITFTLKYGTTDRVTETFSSITETFTDEGSEFAYGKFKPSVDAEIIKLKAYLDKMAGAASVKVPPDKTSLYRAGETLYYYWLHYSLTTQVNDDDIINSVTCTLKYGTDDVSNFFSVNKKVYNIDNYENAYNELEELGNDEINALLNFFSTTSGVKLITVDRKGSQETSAMSHDPNKSSVVMVAYGVDQQCDESSLGNLTYLDVNNIVNKTSSAWTVTGGTPVAATVNVQSEQGLVISDGLSDKA